MKMMILLSLMFITTASIAQDSTKTVISKDSPQKTDDADYDKTFTKTEIEASYPGGPMAWTRFLNKTLRYPDKAINNSIQGVVMVQFIVDKDGNTSDFRVVSGPEKGGLREEAIRVIKLSGKWVPAVQNGRQVKAYKIEAITFKLVTG